MNEIKSSRESKMEALERLSAIGKAVSPKNPEHLSNHYACKPDDHLAEEKAMMDSIYDDIWNEHTMLR